MKVSHDTIHVYAYMIYILNTYKSAIMFIKPWIQNTNSVEMFGKSQSDDNTCLFPFERHTIFLLKCQLLLTITLIYDTFILFYFI